MSKENTFNSTNVVLKAVPVFAIDVRSGIRSRRKKKLHGIICIMMCFGSSRLRHSISLMKKNFRGDLTPHAPFHSLIYSAFKLALAVQ